MLWKNTSLALTFPADTFRSLLRAQYFRSITAGVGSVYAGIKRHVQITGLNILLGSVSFENSKNKLPLNIRSEERRLS